MERPYIVDPPLGYKGLGKGLINIWQQPAGEITFMITAFNVSFKHRREGKEEHKYKVIMRGREKGVVGL